LEDNGRQPHKNPIDIPRRINSPCYGGEKIAKPVTDYAMLQRGPFPFEKRGAPASVPVDLILIIRKRIAFVARAVGFECFTSFAPFNVLALSARREALLAWTFFSSPSSSSSGVPFTLRRLRLAAYPLRLRREYSPNTVALEEIRQENAKRRKLKGNSARGVSGEPSSSGLLPLPIFLPFGKKVCSFSRHERPCKA